MVANPSASRNDPVALECVAELVRALGGPAAVARALGLSTAGVCMWYQPSRLSRCPGIPPAYHARLWRLARAKGVAWTPPGFEGFSLVPVQSGHPDDANVTAAQSARENTVKDDAA
jgi:hypothetical protein